MANSYLRVVFPMTDNLKYNNADSWRCLEFKNCAFWQPAHSVSWVNLPANKFAMFFESRRCRADNKFVFISTEGIRSGINKFQSPQSIQSMMIGESRNYTRHPLSTRFKCPTNSRVNEATGVLKEVNVNSTSSSDWCSDDGSVVYSGLSPNWHAVLP